MCLGHSGFTLEDHILCKSWVFILTILVLGSGVTDSFGIFNARRNNQCFFIALKCLFREDIMNSYPSMINCGVFRKLSNNFLFMYLVYFVWSNSREHNYMTPRLVDGETLACLMLCRWNQRLMTMAMFLGILVNVAQLELICTIYLLFFLDFWTRWKATVWQKWRGHYNYISWQIGLLSQAANKSTSYRKPGIHCFLYNHWMNSLCVHQKASAKDSCLSHT